MNTKTELLAKLATLSDQQVAYFASDMHKNIFYVRPHHWTAEQWANREWLISQICRIVGFDE